METKYKKLIRVGLDLYQEKNKRDSLNIKNDATPYIKIIIKITIDVL
jgi:hypothetical protein